ncbi:MAG: hypothetical protein AAFR31_19975 [Cyanobacteria bacterium J06627_8]
MSEFFKGAIAVHKPSNTLFRAEHLRDGRLFPGESPTCFSVNDCRVAATSDIPTNRPFMIRVGDSRIHIRFDETLQQFVLTDGKRCLGVRPPLEQCEFFEDAVHSFARFFDGAIVDEESEPQLLPHWERRRHEA